MKVKLFSLKEYEMDYLIRSNRNKHEFSFESEPLSINNVHTCQGYNVVSVFTNDDLSGEILQKLHNLNIHYISIRATGYDHVDLKQADLLNIRVANVPEYSPYSVAEQAIMLILALSRKMIIANDQIRHYNFTLNTLVGSELHEKTVGIIGMGRIGSTLAKILNGFGCKILAYDKAPNFAMGEKYEVEYCTLEKVLTQSDIISLHIPLSDTTRYIIDETSIASMKDDVMLINTGRGGLVKTKAVLEGLRSGKIGYFGMDVYEKEKGLFFYDHSKEILKDDILLELLSFNNVLITPHQGFLTSTALQDIADTTVYNIDCWNTNTESMFEITSLTKIT